MGAWAATGGGQEGAQERNPTRVVADVDIGDIEREAPRWLELALSLGWEFLVIDLTEVPNPGIYASDTLLPEVRPASPRARSILQ